MKKTVFLMLLGFSILVSLALVPFFNTGKIAEDQPREYATCYGKNPCNACSNCSRCAHCNAGGVCGKCVRVNASTKSNSPSYKSTQKSSAVSSGQCRAKTKKGTRCSRNSRSGGYCWQHGG